MTNEELDQLLYDHDKELGKKDEIISQLEAEIYELKKEYVSNCCSARVENGTCTDCKEPCELVETE